MKELNLLTKRLLGEGYTKENHPDYVRDFNEYYGGFEYTLKAIQPMVFITPCGLLVKGSNFLNGHMSLMGVDWTVENDCPTILCPYFKKEPCLKNHELLRQCNIATCIRSERLVYCACKRTNQPYDYNFSIEKAHNDVWREAETLFNEFKQRRDGRACHQQCSYNRTTKTWQMHYDVQQCAHSGCTYCDILQKDLSPKRGNVFYDLKTTCTVKGFGLIPDEKATSISKGHKLLTKSASITICEEIARTCKKRIRDRCMLNRHSDFFQDPSLEIEILNLRAERKESRDLLQDLDDIKAGFKVTHISDQKKAAAEAKRSRRTKSKEARIKKLERLLSEKGYENLDGIDKIRIDKYIEPARMEEIMKQETPEQISLF